MEDTFYHSNLHIRVFEGDDSTILPIINDLANNENTKKEWRDSIEVFCKDDLYNYGKSSEYLVEWIEKWYQRREILK